MGALAITLTWAITPFTGIFGIVCGTTYANHGDLICAALALVVLVDAPTANCRWAWACTGIMVIVFWLLALACKEDAVLLPVYPVARISHIAVSGGTSGYHRV